MPEGCEDVRADALALEMPFSGGSLTLNNEAPAPFFKYNCDGSLQERSVQREVNARVAHLVWAVREGGFCEGVRGGVSYVPGQLRSCWVLPAKSP